jgi:hypothetical protein
MAGVQGLVTMSTKEIDPLLPLPPDYYNCGFATPELTRTGHLNFAENRTSLLSLDTDCRRKV